MTDLQRLKECLESMGAVTVTKENGNWQYLFLCNTRTKPEFETKERDELLRTARYFEFLKGKLVGY